VTPFWEPKFRPSDKREAEEARDYWRGVKRHGLYSAAVLGGLTTAGVIAAPIPAVACVVAAWVAESIYDSQETLAKDPARFDYDAVTGPVMRRLYVEALGNSPLEVATIETGTAVLSTAADTNALVRAVERAAGAAQRERAEHFTRQINASRRFRADTVRALKNLPSRVEPLAAGLETGPAELAAIGDAEARSLVRANRLERTLPPEALALCYRLGISIRLLREHVSRPKSMNPLVDLSGALRAAAKESATFGQVLESWDPSPDNDEGPSTDFTRHEA
jgi:hypothetical protein